MSAAADPRIFPLGDSALTVEFGSIISEPLNKTAIALADHMSGHPFPGFIEAVPAYASTTVYYHPHIVRQNFDAFSTAFEAVRSLAEDAMAYLGYDADIKSRTVEIPVDFSASAGLDLQDIAVHASMSVSEVIETFTSATYRVYMLGFLPGFSYMGEVDERIAAPRRATPRLAVPKGSVGIAGRQTGIYSLESPGGWQIVGRTDIEMFSPGSPEPCHLRPGDNVRFVRV